MSNDGLVKAMLPSNTKTQMFEYLSVSCSDQHTSLLHCVVNFGGKKLYSWGPLSFSFGACINLFTVVNNYARVLWHRQSHPPQSNVCRQGWNLPWCNPNQGILKGDVSLNHWPPVWLVWNQLYDYWQFLFLFVKKTNPNQSKRRSTVQWYFPL